MYFWWRGDYEQVAEHFRHALDLAREIGDQGLAAGALAALGTVSTRRREYGQAHDLYTALAVPEAGEIRSFLTGIPAHDC
ncbi:hypothetical protein ACFVHW_02515 [Streptomyces sp. NPDC127110]|uniref:hypothetical protein n=1 Tax=Streptomyces sp. NPDC127110 TaxID=3345362 RepID=UPI003638AB41